MPGPTSAKTYKCDLCGRTFARTEHLERHRRIHTREKPYPCHQCSARFARTDLLRRHQLSHHAQSQGHGDQNGGTQGSTSLYSQKRLRTKIACRGCNLRKLKCDSERPCGRCRAGQIECVSLTETPHPWTNDRINPIQRNDAGGSDSQDPHSLINSESVQSDLQASPQRNPLDGRSVHSTAHPFSSALSVRRPGENVNAELPWPQNHRDENAVRTGLQGDSDASAANPLDAGTQRYVHFEAQVPTQQQVREEQHMDISPDFDFNFNFTTSSKTYNWVNTPLFSENDGQNGISFNDSLPLGGLFDGVYDNDYTMEFNLDDTLDSSFFALQDTFRHGTPSQGDVEATQINYPSSTRAGASTGDHSDAHFRLRAFSEHISAPPSPSISQERNRWISGLGKEAPLSSAMHDRAIIDEFLWLFQDHVAVWFSCFRDIDLKITRQTRKEWYLAMAAIGALFCRIDGSTKIARWLYHCARQKLFSFVYGKKALAPKISDGISVVETYMLLELFGYLSGDKRIYELTEAMHLQMIQSVHDLKIFRPNTIISEEKRQKLLESLLIFDCYRVVLLQRPPAMPLFLPTSSETPTTILATADGVDDSFGSNLRAFATPGALADSFQSTSESYKALCSLALMTWNVVPAPFTKRGPITSVWSTSFCELALNQWASAHDTYPNKGIMLLYHTVHLNMLVCLPAVQNIVVVYLNRCGSSGSSKDKQKRQGDPERLPGRLALENLFVSPGERSKAIWHARRIMYLALPAFDSHESGTRRPRQNTAHTNESRQDDILEESEKVESSGPDDSEPPHFSHCVSFAVLVLWCDTMLSSGLSEQASKQWPEMGMKVLNDSSRDSSRIKGLFKSIFVDMVAYAE